MFIHVILDVHSHLYSIQESRIFSRDSLEDAQETQRRMSSSSAPWGLKFCTELPLSIYVISGIQSHLNSIQVSKMSSKPPWRKLWILMGERLLPVNQEVWHLAQSFLNLYMYHSWHPKLAKFYSGITNVLQDSLVDALETHRRFSSSYSLRD